jgi:hypothetical protein
VTTLRWLQEGAPIPKGHRLVQVLMRERRTIGTGTNMAEFILCELEVLNSRAGVSE